MIINKTKIRDFLFKWWPLIIILGFITISFFWGWFLDGSKPVSGTGWSDQTKYIGAAERLASGMLPTAFQMHYSIGYPVMGAIGQILTGDPFAAVSFGLLIVSTVFCYLAFTKILGRWFGSFGVLLLFMWDWVARDLNFSIEIFTIPWNNQMLFFGFALFFWLLTNRMDKPQPYWLVILVAFVSGMVIMSREESLVFLAPMLVVWLLVSKSGWKKILLSLAIIPIVYSPQLIVKDTVLGSISDSGRGNQDYSSLLDRYLNPALLVRNVSQTIIGDSETEALGRGRDSLLQAAPWLWLSFPGFILLLSPRRYSFGVKVFTVVSFALLLFYLSGANMSANKLAFHCLRYIAPAYILMNLGAMVTVREGYLFIKGSYNRQRQPKGKDFHSLK